MMAAEWYKKMQESVKDMVPILRALADPMRLAIFQRIRGCGGASGYFIASGLCDGGMEGGLAMCEESCRMPCCGDRLIAGLIALQKAGLIDIEGCECMVYARVRPDALARIAGFCSYEVACRGAVWVT